MFFVKFVLLTKHEILETNIYALKSLLYSSRKIVILTHTNPDGDALGSALGLLDVLTAANYTLCKVIVPNGWPDFLEWMPLSEEVLIAEKDNQAAFNLIQEAELIFCLDFNGASRISFLEKPFLEAKGKKVLIDHHPQPEAHFDLYFSDVSPSSTSEMVFRIAEQLGYGHLVSKQGADCFYTGIMTDTGSFSYSCNSPETYLIVSRLIELGVDAEAIHKLVYDNNTESRLRLLGYCISEKLKVIAPKGVAFISLSLAELERFNYKEGDTEGIVNYALSMKHVDFAAIFVEHPEFVRISFRSKGRLNVNDFAREFFNGGGHKNAAGGRSYESFQSTIGRFEKLVSQHPFFQDAVS